MSESTSGNDLIRSTQSGRRDAQDDESTPPSPGAEIDTGITGDDTTGGGLTGPGAGLPDVAASGVGGPNSGASENAECPAEEISR